jgi:2-methylcitrate dehydratase PrpD
MASKSVTAADRLSAPGITGTLAARAAGLRFDSLPDDIVELARQCLLDFLGVTIAGANDPAVQIVLDEVMSQGGHPQASLVGRPHKVATHQAALVNGVASHSLDYDDVNWSLEGHPSVAIIPGLLALAEYRGACGSDFITAFVAGYETACRIGKLVSPSHYKRGFHATSTVGSFGAAAACARLLGLNGEQTAIALGIAGTQAAGLKSMFGTMCKPLHAGKAAQNGLLAALLAARGFDSRPDVLECVQGFAQTQSDDYNFEAASEDPPGDYHLRANLFKYHAACYMTHSAIECTRRLMNRFKITPESVREVIVYVDPALDGVCNISEPKTGLEAKFSLRLMTAFALADVDTASIESYSNDNCARLAWLRDRVRVAFKEYPLTKCDVEILLRDSRTVSDTYDSGVPAADLTEQRIRLESKFRSLVVPIRPGDTVSLIRLITELPRLQDLNDLFDLCRGAVLD